MKGCGIMKEKMNFFTVVVSLLLLSSIILTGCMFSVTTDTGTAKPYGYTAKEDLPDNTDSANDLRDIIACLKGAERMDKCRHGTNGTELLASLFITETASDPRRKDHGGGIGTFIFRIGKSAKYLRQLLQCISH